MLITHGDLDAFCESHILNYDPDNVEHEALVVRLNSRVFKERRANASVTLENPAELKPDVTMTPVVYDKYVQLQPGGFMLAYTVEQFNLPTDVWGLFTLRSKYARMGLGHTASLVLKPGWRSMEGLAMELTNNLKHHTLFLRKGEPLGQIMFFRC